MRFLWICCCFFILGASAFAGGRSEWVVDEGKFYEFTVGAAVVRLSVSADVANVRVNFGLKDLLIPKVMGFRSNDTHRTLIYTAGSSRLYFANDAGVPGGKVKLVCITD